MDNFAFWLALIFICVTIYAIGYQRGYVKAEEEWQLKWVRENWGRRV